MIHVAIIDYGSGNLRSCSKAFSHVLGNAGEVMVTTDPRTVKAASHIVLPGVGAFGDCVKGLKSVSGMIEQIQESVMTYKKPFLGICVGMQMLFERGLEHGEHDGLGWIKGEVVKLAPKDSALKIPHMGWNELHFKKTDHPLFKDISQGAHAYFVHSFQAVCKDAGEVLATTEYGGEVAAVVGHDNIMGTQFHPEKSQETGLHLLRNFLSF